MQKNYTGCRTIGPAAGIFCLDSDCKKIKVNCKWIYFF